MSLLAPCSRDLVSILFVFYFETKGTVLQFFYLNSFNHNIVAYQSPEKVLSVGKFISWFSSFNYSHLAMPRTGTRDPRIERND